ncbi:hypothetical protein [Anseongella ginsenosidimutans]|nr:hypothetical protein [Anseongella ginsenosidimutans]QEC52438.1 hypothetical protein FRZ59_08900 [Anseongella ginsenosidimutans]
MDIADAILEIKAEVGTLDFRSLNEYNEDEYSQQAISTQLAQIGTAAAMLSQEFKDEYGTIDWDVLIGLQFAGDDQELELDTHSEWSLIEYDLTEIGQEVLDLSGTVQSQEDLERVSLNEEDLEDLTERQQKEKAAVESQSQDVEDEADQYTEYDRASEEEDDSFIDQRYNNTYIRDASDDSEEDDSEKRDS